jgi:hypothetical protein
LFALFFEKIGILILKILGLRSLRLPDPLINFSREMGLRFKGNYSLSLT